MPGSTIEALLERSRAPEAPCLAAHVASGGLAKSDPCRCRREVPKPRLGDVSN